MMSQDLLLEFRVQAIGKLIYNGCCPDRAGAYNKDLSVRVGDGMHIYVIKKYNPVLYDERGVYTKDEWTDVSDIGQIFAGKKLTRQDYMAVEDIYVNSIKKLIHQNNISRLTVCSDGFPPDLCNDNYLFEIEFNKAYNYKNGDVLNLENIEIFSRLCLRNVNGYALTDYGSFFILFSHDYYVHIGSEEKIHNIEKIIYPLFFEYRGKLGFELHDDVYDNLLDKNIN